MNEICFRFQEVIDDLIRQVLKSCYNIDINNLPLNTYDQKRKLKKKILYNPNTTPLSAQSSAPASVQSPTQTATIATVQSTSSTCLVPNTSTMQQQPPAQQQKMNIFSKTRSQTHTETSSPSFNGAPFAHAPSSNFISTSSIINQSNVTPLGINNNTANTTTTTTNHNNSSSSSSNTTLSTSLPLNVQTNTKPEGLSNSATISGTKQSVQPLLNRQRKRFDSA